MINIFQNNQNKFDRLIHICFISLPLFLISGPLIPEIVVILISIYAIIKIVKNQKYRFFLNNKYIKTIDNIYQNNNYYALPL